MQAFVTGATGVLGRRLVRELVSRGFAVVGTARGEQGARLVREAGGSPVEVDLFDADALARAADGSEVVIHGATAIPTSAARRPSSWALNDRLRREGTRALTHAAVQIGARRYLQQSIVWVVRPEGGEAYDEATRPNPSPVTRSAVDSEEIALEAGARHGIATSVLRCGVFYSADAAHTVSMAGMLRRRQLPIIGSGDALFASIHADDAANAFAAACSAGSGTYHIVDDHPFPFAEWLRTFAGALGAPPPRRVPIWLAKLLAGSGAVDMVTRSMNTSNAKARAQLRWEPRYPSFNGGIAEIAREWQGR